MNVKIYMYMYKCNVYDNFNKRIKFYSKLFLYMYYLIFKYGVGGWYLVINYYENLIFKNCKN